MIDSEPEELLEGNDWSPETLTVPIHISISADDSEREVENIFHRRRVPRRTDSG